MDTEAALHAAIADRPHDTTPRKVLADWYEDQGMPEHAIAHRWLAEPSTAPTTHKEWAEQTRGLDGSKVARILTDEAHKSTEASRRGTSQIYEHSHPVDDRARRLVSASRGVLDHATSGRPLDGHHASLMRGHESLASEHESLSYHGVQDSNLEHSRKVRHEAAGALHRQAQAYHTLAYDAHYWNDHDNWLASREE